MTVLLRVLYRYMGMAVNLFGYDKTPRRSLHAHRDDGGIWLFSR